MSTSASTQATPTSAPADQDFEAALRQAAQGVDSGQEVSSELLTSSSSAKQEEQAAGADTGTETGSEGSDRKDGTELTAEQQQQAGAKKNDGKPDAKPGEQTQESAYSKAKKDQERLEKTWKKYQENLAAFEAKQQQIAERERQLTEREQRLQQQAGGERRDNQPLTDQHGFSATQYAAYADKCEKEGKFELADAAREAAKQLREREQQTGTQRAPAQGTGTKPTASTAPDQTPGTPEFKAKWNQNLAALTAQPEFADLGKKDSALFKATAEVLNSDPRFSQHADGIQFAARFAQLQLEASSVPTLRKQLQEQSQELEKLRKATSPGGGNSESRGRTKSFDEMTPAEQEAAILKNAEAVDAS